MTLWQWCKNLFQKPTPVKFSDRGEIAPEMQDRETFHGGGNDPVPSLINEITRRKGQWFMDPDDQLRSWLEGKPIHNYTNNSCVPDQSCCHPKLLAPKPIRTAFIMADPQTRLEFVTLFSRRAHETFLQTNNFKLEHELDHIKH